MKKVLCTALLGMFVLLGSQAQAQDTFGNKLGQFADANKSGPIFVIDPSHYAPSTHFIFLETKDDSVTADYKGKVKRLIRAIGFQPGFRASLTLGDIDLKRIVVYYQFESEDQQKAARENANVMALAQALQSASARFDDYAAAPQATIIKGVEGSAPPGYISKFQMSDGVAINEAVVGQGRSQDELTALMQGAGVVANPNTSPGYIDFTFHKAIDSSRNMNLLHWSSVRAMAAGALGPLVQNLINGGLTGGTNGWGPTGPGFIGVHVYSIVDIQNAQR